MTSRRKAKRADITYVIEGIFVQTEDGDRKVAVFTAPWYKRYKTGKGMDKNPEAMWGCVKKSKQQKHRGSWNLIGIDPWYGKGYISWKRD